MEHKPKDTIFDWFRQITLIVNDRDQNYQEKAQRQERRRLLEMEWRTRRLERLELTKKIREPIISSAV